MADLRDRIQAGQVCWAAVRNPKENPSHSVGVGKDRPVIVASVERHSATVIGTTTLREFQNGTPRERIPYDLWEGRYRGQIEGAGYFWGGRPARLPGSDISGQVGTAPTRLRMLAACSVSDLAPGALIDLVTAGLDETAIKAMELGAFYETTVSYVGTDGLSARLDDGRVAVVHSSSIVDGANGSAALELVNPGDKVVGRCVGSDDLNVLMMTLTSSAISSP